MKIVTEKLAFIKSQFQNRSSRREEAPYFLQFEPRYLGCYEVLKAALKSNLFDIIPCRQDVSPHRVTNLLQAACLLGNVATCSRLGVVQATQL